MAEYEITYSITRDGDEIGFGTSGSSVSVDAALHNIDSDIQNQQWETTSGMPDPEEVARDCGR